MHISVLLSYVIGHIFKKRYNANHRHIKIANVRCYLKILFEFFRKNVFCWVIDTFFHFSIRFLCHFEGLLWKIKKRKKKKV